MISGSTETRGVLSLGYHEENEAKNRTRWNFELWRDLHRLVDLDYAIRRRVIYEALKLKDENRWQHLDEQFLARLAKARLTELHRLRVRDP